MSLFQFAKRRFLFIVILIAVLLLGAVALVMLNLGKVVNSNKDLILAKAEEAVGREITIDQIDVTLWTGVGVRLSDFSIADDPTFSSERFVRADDLEIYFKLLPLFQKKLEISHLTLVKPSITIIQNKEGIYNFSTLLSDEPSTNDESASPSQNEKASALSLARLEIEDGVIHYQNKAKAEEIRLQNLDATIRNFALDQSFHVDLKTALSSGDQNISFIGQIGPLASAYKELSVNGDLRLAALQLPAIAKMPVIQSSIPSKLNMDGAVDAEIHLEGNLKNVKVNVELDGADAVLVYNQQYEKPKGMPLNIAVQSNYAGDALDIQNLKFKAAQFDVDGKGKISLGDTAAFDFSLQSKPISLSWIASILPDYNIYKPAGQATVQANLQKKGKEANLKGTATLENVSVQIPKLAKPIHNLKGKIRFDLNQAQTEEMTLQMGQSDIIAEAVINPLLPITMKYNLASSKIFVSDFIDPPEAMKNDFIEEAAISGILNIKEGLVSSGDISSKQGVLYGLNYTYLKSPFQLKDLIFTLSDLSLQTLKGQVEGQVRYDMQKDPAQFDISTQTHSIDLAEAVRTKVSWLPDYLQGKVDLNLDLTGSGTTWEAIQPSLKGSGAMEIAEGMLLNVNIADSVLNGLTDLPGITNFLTTNYKQEYPKVFNTQHTVFEVLKMETAIQEGRIDFTNMLIAASDWAVNGEGWMNFGQQLKSDSLLRLSKSFTSFLTNKVDAFKFLTDENGNLSIPFSMNGTLPTVKPQPNNDFVGGILQKAVAGKVMDKLNLQGIPGLPNLLPLPFDTGAKKQKDLPPLSADKTVPTTPTTDVKRETSPARGSLPQVQSATSRQSETPVSLPRAATPTLSKPTEIKPADLLNPLLKLIDKKK